MLRLFIEALPTVNIMRWAENMARRKGFVRRLLRLVSRL